MRPSLKALSWVWAVSALSAAAVIPPVPPPGNYGVKTESKHTAFELDSQDHQAKATFTVPCVGCLGQESESSGDEALLFSLEVFSSEKPCGISNITLNGRYLAQEWNGDYARGKGTFLGVADLEENDWFRQHDLNLEWESACLHVADFEEGGTPQPDDAGQVLTVTIKGIDGKVLEKATGFTISFTQLAPPELLRIATVPTPEASKIESARSWLDPPPHERLVDFVDESADEPEPKIASKSIEDQIRELEELEGQAKDLRKAIREKKLQIKAQLRSEVRHAKHEIQQCDSISCVFKTIIHKAHGAFRIIYFRFRPVRHHGHEEMGRLSEHNHYQSVSHAVQSEVQALEVESHPSHGSPPPCHGNRTDDHPLPPPPPHDRPGNPGSPPPPPHHPPHHGHGDDGPPPPPEHGDDGPPSGPPPHGPPPPHHGHGHGSPPPPPPLHRPHSPFRHYHHHILAVLASAIGLTCLFAFLRRRCSSIRSRTDRRARREERRTARQYRRARGDSDTARIDDYEEKRGLIRAQEEILESAMQEEIRQLRAAHLVVNSLVQAEEGRAGHISPVELVAGGIGIMAESPGIQSHPLSRTNSLPDYRSDAGSMEPPAYEDDEDSSDVVVDGFREYTPSTTTVWTPESSVIDVSPRPSGETMRLPVDLDGDVKN
ncbi:hypothetical protein K432DRAFT_422812 [Lepidopterella palustris CBS 459.81]|uniref:Cyanovirin-N domain-containing protein n=1 Tax=Lepidopterella palustris CBS 459.81 TaxID=1314670 RepID=A0A8E2JJ34_9PEZI|nr:hypothetical protein K432DRAFT_422812 [Lepidopterella palustris CBS 459.81]